MKFRFLAGLLAAGGIFFGLLSSPIMFRTRASLLFLPGYLITAGYIIRCVSNPRISWRRVIWVASVFVQGAWLFSIVAALIYTELTKGHATADDVFSPIVAWVWWIFALGVSIHGYRFDKTRAA